MSSREKENAKKNWMMHKNNGFDRQSFTLVDRGDHFRFSSVFIYKNNWTEFFLYIKKPKPNRTWFEPTSFVSIFYVKNQKNLYCFLTFKSHKIKPIFITSSPHNSVESIPAFSQANSLLQNHKNISRSLTLINHSSLSQTQKPTSPKTILSNTNHHHHNKHCPVPTATFFTHFPFIKKKTQQLSTTQTIKYCLHKSLANWRNLTAAKA
jgi:hypothetical protein